VRFAVEASRRLGSLVSGGRCGIEPTIPGSGPRRPDVKDYSTLLSEVAAALWHENPSAVLVTGGLSTVDEKFLSSLVPLVDLAGPGRPHRTRTASVPEYDSGDGRGRVAACWTVTDDGRAATAGGVRVWLTEWGYCRGIGGMDATRQAEWMVRIPLGGAALDSPLTVLVRL